MSTEANKTLVRRYRDIHNSNNLAALERSSLRTSSATMVFLGSLQGLKVGRWPIWHSLLLSPTVM